MNAFDICSFIFSLKFLSLLLSFLIIFLSFFIINLENNNKAFSFSFSISFSKKPNLKFLCKSLKHKQSLENKQEKKSDSNKKIKENHKDKLKIGGIQSVNYSTIDKKYYFGKIEENISSLVEKACKYYKEKQNIPEVKNKNDDLNLMQIECMSSMNYTRNNELEKSIFQRTNWQIAKEEDDKNDEDRIVIQNIFPSNKFFIDDGIVNMNVNRINNFNNSNNKLSFSNSSINSFDETEDEFIEEGNGTKLYKLSIIRKFNNIENDLLKTNIVKDPKEEDYFKIYSQGDPTLIRNICKPDTLPENFDKEVENYYEKGKKTLALAGKIIKANYLQAQKISRKKCESNMVFLGFIIINNS